MSWPIRSGPRVRICDVLAALDAIAPPELAEPWDNVGLLVGDPAAECRRAIVTLETDLGLLRRAASRGADLIVSHHPPIFEPLKRLVADATTGRLVLEAARAGVALAAAHTNYDVAPGGVNDVLAGLLGLQRVEPLARTERSPRAKIVVFTPQEDREAVIAALSAAGAGVIGEYRECMFRSAGTATFRPLADARPTKGRAGRREEVEELRLEAIVPLALADRAAAAARAAHSCEEPAIDIYPLGGQRLEVGIGRCGRLPEPVPALDLIERIKRKLGVRLVRVVGPTRRKVATMGLCAGSGGRYVQEAARRGCDLYLTGDLSHHQALDAAAAGLLVADAGHAATEAPAIPALARRLAEGCPGVEFEVARGAWRRLFKTC